MNSQPKISRRAFLAGALSTVAIAALEACQRSSPTDVPVADATATMTPTPPTVTARATATALKPPTPTAANTLTPTPQATKTPWPTATPAHYTQPSKLGLVVQRFSSPQIMDVIEAGKPKVVKIIDDLGSAGVVKERVPKTIIVGRISVDYDFRALHDKNNRDAARHAADFIARNMDKYKANTNLDYWEGYNEPIIESADMMADYAAFEAERVKQMAALGLAVLHRQLFHRHAPNRTMGQFFARAAGCATAWRLPGLARILRADNAVRLWPLPTRSQWRFGR